MPKIERYAFAIPTNLQPPPIPQFCEKCTRNLTAYTVAEHTFRPAGLPIKVSPRHV